MRLGFLEITICFFTAPIIRRVIKVGFMTFIDVAVLAMIALIPFMVGIISRGKRKKGCNGMCGSCGKYCHAHTKETQDKTMGGETWKEQ